MPGGNYLVTGAVAYQELIVLPNSATFLIFLGGVICISQFIKDVFLSHKNYKLLALTQPNTLALSQGRLPMTQCQDEVRILSGRTQKLKVAKRCWKQLNEHNLMYIYHTQCENMQKNQ